MNLFKKKTNYPSLDRSVMIIQFLQVVHSAPPSGLYHIIHRRIIQHRLIKFFTMQYCLLLFRNSRFHRVCNYVRHVFNSNIHTKNIIRRSTEVIAYRVAFSR